MTEQLHFHFSLSCIGEGNGNHSSVLAWRIPGTGEPDGLPSLGSHRVRHDWSDLAAAAAAIIGNSFLKHEDLLAHIIEETRGSYKFQAWLIQGSRFLSFCFYLYWLCTQTGSHCGCKRDLSSGATCWKSYDFPGGLLNSFTFLQNYTDAV